MYSSAYERRPTPRDLLSEEELAILKEEGRRRRLLVHKIAEDRRAKYSEQRALGRYDQLMGKWVCTDSNGNPALVCQTASEIIEKCRLDTDRSPGIVLHVGYEDDPVAVIDSVWE